MRKEQEIQYFRNKLKPIIESTLVKFDNRYITFYKNGRQYISYLKGENLNEE